jgi:RNA polymerase sigma-70 factor (ECF subfamily)
VSKNESDSARFTVLFERYSPRVFAYARRRSDAAVADDVTAETFLVAWRRIEDVPDDPLPWLLVIARNTLANRRRSSARRARLRLELAALERLAAPEPGVDRTVIDRSTMLSALAALTELEREAVLLVAWDGLPTRSAAQVAGCSERSFAVRLHRARARLSRLMNSGDNPTANFPLLEEIS